MSEESERSFGAIRWHPSACGLVLALYLAAWWTAGHFWRAGLTPLRGSFSSLDDATFWEYGSLVISCLVKLLATAGVLLVIRGSATPGSALGMRLFPAHSRWLGTALLLLWFVLVIAGLSQAWTFAGPQPSSRADEPPLDSPLILTTLALRSVVNPLCEELVFRSLVYLTLRQYLGVSLGMLSSVLIFGLWHISGGLGQMTVAALMGGVLVVVYERSRSLPQAYLAHSSFNLGKFLLALAQGHL